MGNVREHRLAAAKAYIAGCLQETAPGGRLPSVHDMIAASGATRSAVTRALDHYQAAGALRVRPKSGTVKLPAAPGKAGNIIDVVRFHSADPCDMESRLEGASFGAMLDNDIADELSRRGFGQRFHPVGTESLLRDIVELRGLRDSAGFILLRPALREIAAEFERAGKPVVTAFPRASWPQGVQVVNSPLTMRRQMDYLIGLGHTRIAHLYADRYDLGAVFSRTSARRHSDYFRIMAEHGFRAPPHWAVDFGENEEEVRAALERMFSAEPRPTALIVMDFHLLFAYRALDSLGFAPGRDVAVMATDGLEICRRVTPAATSTVNPHRDAARLIRELFERQMNGDASPVTRTLDIGLREGDSTFVLPRAERPQRRKT